MSERSTILRPEWRLAACATLVLWVFAFGLCTAHCALGKRHSGAPGVSRVQGLPPCHGCPSNSESESKAASSFCFTIKSLFSDDAAPLKITGPGGTIFFEHGAAFLRMVAASELLPTSLRERDWGVQPFTPEVCLGPAYRAHAPPVFL